ncbi:MAG: hypothetical protein IJJ42_07250 [Clostridia bacterium]|nr:hypothetical protein [Clostridia bacterium]
MTAFRDPEKAQMQGCTFPGPGFVPGCFAALVILLVRSPIINYYKVSAETNAIAWQLMDAISFIAVFLPMNFILTKCVLQTGGDPRFLMAGDILFLWAASVPLGLPAGFVFRRTLFRIYTMLKIDRVIKCVCCFFRLRRRKWMKRILAAGGS